ncbi:hypothetical protein PtA15_4A603 [Puccinia triticina]|uniref:Uncharacterized protein n=1 Tax=Puccinia triticina TaxID=208348 RepID=A0ABY7CJL7_9BASI|nr:uncharacterized protein PtA15_4A603 [Puccinia triticina]WAQ84152.1 hypothetical protein PtA15_4A603 [Puccinia triticina]
MYRYMLCISARYGPPTELHSAHYTLLSADLRRPLVAKLGASAPVLRASAPTLILAELAPLQTIHHPNPPATPHPMAPFPHCCRLAAHPPSSFHAHSGQFFDPNLKAKRLLPDSLTKAGEDEHLNGGQSGPGAMWQLVTNYPTIQPPQHRPTTPKPPNHPKTAPPPHRPAIYIVEFGRSEQ